MNKYRIIDSIIESGIIAVIRAENRVQAVKIADACIAGGVNILEITFTVPGVLQVIEELNNKYRNKPEVLVGAGTILDPETARTSILAGAKFIVSPIVDEDIIKLCNCYQILTIPGAMTMTEIVRALEAGAEIIKAFPGEVLGPSFIKAVKGPLPNVQLIPTGGVNLENIEDWMKAGAVAVGIGGSLTGAAQNGNYQEITTLAEQILEIVRRCKVK